ncbi:hypothetical protein MMC30_005563 [Trapelia coarctata]|nr:hypothetical protein [Trapelia coarctata]
MKVMRDEHDFKASQTAYKKHFKDWGWAKKVPKDVANYMRIEARRREEEEGKATRYRFHGFEIPAHRFKRGAADGSETVISKPPCLSIETPDDSLKKRRSQVYHIDDSTIAHIASENAARRTIVEVHQGVQDVFKAQNIVENPTSTDERLEAYAFGQKVLIDEFSSMPVAHLCELLAGYVNRGYYCGTDLILENILIQSEEIHNTDNDLVLDTAQHEVLMVRNLVLQHKFWTASKVIDGILGKKDFEGSLPRYRLQIHKLALLVAVDERKREPRDLDQVESRCIVLIAEEVATLPTTNRYWAINLILVYLYRLHGINGKALREPSVARMQEVLKTQFSLESPSRSFIWVAQQYVHWCLRRMQYEEALGTLKGIEGILRMVCGPESLEAAQNARLQELYDRSRYKPNALTVEDIYLYNPLDKQCLDALRGYLRDEPRLTAEERYTKEMDEDYLF